MSDRLVTRYQLIKHTKILLYIVVAALNVAAAVSYQNPFTIAGNLCVAALFSGFAALTAVKL